MSGEMLHRLVHEVKGVEMTAAEREEQRRSFAHGNVSLSNQDVTREVVDQAADAEAQNVLSSRVCIGLDLSIRSPGIVALPWDWRPGDWGSVYAVSMKERKGIAGARRLHEIGRFIFDRVRDGWLTRAKFGAHPSPPAIAIEQHAFAMASGAYALERAELVGVVKERIFDAFGVETIPIVASSARKLLLGRMPRMSRKEWKLLLLDSFTKFGAPFAGQEDCVDAAVIANALRYRIGLTCLSSG
jgi:hypothetical protein